MLPTLLGLVLFLVGGYLLTCRGVIPMFICTVVCLLMGGSAAFIVTALGSSSIPPVSVAYSLLMLRILLDPEVRSKHVMPALRNNALYWGFGLYALASAFIMPRIFANAMDVAPMKAISIKGLFDTVPLAFTSQNITSAVYIIGSCIMATCSFIAMRIRGGALALVKSAIVVTWIHIALGIAGVVLPAAVWDPFSSVFRNGSYALTSQTIDGYARITGIMPEPSTYAALGYAWFVFLAECWLRDVLPKRTGPAAGVMGLVLVFSTSSTAYLGLAVYAVMLLIRMIIFPQTFKGRKVVWLAGSTLVVTTLTLAMMAFNTAMLDGILRILSLMTVEKVNSDSGLQRAFWARQGIEAFKVSGGLGIGAGSFRSSNLITAILGSMGVIGMAFFTIYVLQIFRPFRNSSYAPSRDPLEAVGVACSWTAMAYLAPSIASAPSPDPGALFSLFAGAALGLRTLPYHRPTVQRHKRLIAPIPADARRAIRSSALQP